MGQIIHASGVSDVGRSRDHNEDSYLVDTDLGLYIVCDGMGGAAAGEVASQRCIEIVQRELREQRQLLERYAELRSEEQRAQVQHVLQQAVAAACAEIFAMAERDRGQRGMGTTLALVLATSSDALVAHVGDSRVYLRRQGQLHQLTNDHSVVSEHVRRGLMRPDEADRSPLSNMITRAIGTQQYVRADQLHVELMPGDLFLLCSDGLTAHLAAAEIASILSRAPATAAPGELVGQANQRGGSDNITAIVLSVSEQVSVDPELSATRKLDALENIPLFSHLTYRELMQLLDRARIRHFEPQQRIIEQGSVDDEFFVLLGGEATVVQNEHKLSELHHGDHFGEMCLLDNAPRSATIIATGPVQVLVFKRDDVHRLLQRAPELAVKLLWAFCHELIGRLRTTSAELSNSRDDIIRPVETLPFVSP